MVWSGDTRRHRLLEDHGDAAAAQFAQFGLGGVERGDVRLGSRQQRIAEKDAAAIDLGDLGQDAEDRLSDDGLARSGLADERDRLAGGNPEADALHHFDAALLYRDRNAQVLDTQQVSSVAQVDLSHP